VVILGYTKCSVNIDTKHPLCSQIHYENILKSTQNFTYYFFVVAVDIMPYALQVAWFTVELKVYFKKNGSHFGASQYKHNRNLSPISYNCEVVCLFVCLTEEQQL
jgi:hypothetical protein